MSRIPLRPNRMDLTRDPWGVTLGATIEMVWAALVSGFVEVGQGWAVVSEVVDLPRLRSSSPRAEVHACDLKLPLSERERCPANSSRLPGRCLFAEIVVGEGTVDVVDRPGFAPKVHPS